MNYVYTYVPSSEIAYEVNAGMPLKDYKEAWHKAYGDSHVEFGFNSIAGYTTGVLIEKALAEAESLDQLELREALVNLSNRVKTLDGAFAVDATGAQVGEITPLGQVIEDKGQVRFVTVWPKEVATGKPVYPRP
jgi:branched-chain amino acid transport system substrate-binding protein